MHCPSGVKSSRCANELGEIDVTGEIPKAQAGHRQILLR